MKADISGSIGYWDFYFSFLLPCGQRWVDADAVKDYHRTPHFPITSMAVLTGKWPLNPGKWFDVLRLCRTATTVKKMKDKINIAGIAHCNIALRTTESDVHKTAIAIADSTTLHPNNRNNDIFRIISISFYLKISVFERTVSLNQHKVKLIILIIY